jgi:membrane-bound metal-dependent hydrolase YbcI (DUF457 family)
VPSPIGHLIAGTTVALASGRRDRPADWKGLVLVAALLAALPDADLLVGSHRTFSHSFFAVGVVLLAAMGISRVRAGRIDWRVSMTCALAYGSHLLTDYFGVDYGTPSGLQLFWPWSDQYFISEWSLFRATERYDPLGEFAITMNTLALARELLILGPILLLVLLRRRRFDRNRVGTRPGEGSGGQSGVAVR